MTSSINEPRWRRLPEERPRQILEAALQEFGERGLACARLEDIARRAGLSKGTIYLYFPNKEELFCEVVRHSFIAGLEEGERVVAEVGRSATDALVMLARGHWDFLRSPAFAPLYRMVLPELHHFPELARFYAEEVVQRGQRLFCTVLERGMAAGEFRRTDPREAARMLIALLLTHGLWCDKREFHVELAELTDDQVFEGLMQFYLTAIRPEPAGQTAVVGGGELSK